MKKFVVNVSFVFIQTYLSQLFNSIASKLGIQQDDLLTRAPHKQVIVKEKLETVLDLISYTLLCPFTSNTIMFVEQSYPVEKLKQCYSHLHGLPLRSFFKVQQHILIGSDNPFLITPVERVQ